MSPNNLFNEKIISEVKKVSAINLVGKPDQIIIDSGLVANNSSVLQKLKSLQLNEKTDFVAVESSNFEPPDKFSIAILKDNVEIENVYVLNVGNKEPEKTADTILGLFGTSLVQEKAGAAFRAAGEGKEIPTESYYDAKSILTGISDAITSKFSNAVPNNKLLRDPKNIDLEKETQSIIKSAYEAIDLCFADNGAIAAASPPKTHTDPNYWFFWQRDAGQIAIALNNLAKIEKDNQLKQRIEDRLQKYTQFVSVLPNKPEINTSDLGISRFNMDGKPIITYGNPQNDGPAHTALAVMEILDDNPSEAFTVVKSYLDFLSSPKGNGLTFDPWEFSVGHIFNADNLARKALKRGKELAVLANDVKSQKRYAEKEKMLQGRLGEYYDKNRGYIISGNHFVIPWMDTISNLDISVIGSILTAYDVSDDFMNVDDTRIMKTMSALEEVFTERWVINKEWKQLGNLGCGIGRFPEDTNDGIGSTGGNPWTFATLWTAQYYYRLVERYNYLKKDDNGEYKRLPLVDKADGYLKFVLSHLPTDALTEQIDGISGKPRGAEKLGWAHAELINTLLLGDKVRDKD